MRKTNLFIIVLLFLVVLFFITGFALNANSGNNKTEESEKANTLPEQAEESQKAAQNFNDQFLKHRELAQKTGTSIELIGALEKYAKKYEIPFTLAYELVRLESNFNTEMTSYNEWNDTYDRGLFQLNDNTSPWLAEKIGITNFNYEMTYDPKLNMEMGLWYLSFLYQKYENWHDTLTAYNRGMAGLEKYKQREGTSRSAYSRAILSYRE